MRDEIEAALRRAGLEGFRPVSSIELKPGGSAARAHGDTGRAVVPRARWIEERGSGVEAPELRTAGFWLSELDNDDDVLRILSQGGRPRFVAPPEGSAVELLEAAGFLGIRLSTLRGQPPLVAVADDRLTALAVTETEIHLCAPERLTIKPDAEVRSDARLWSRDSGDEWLHHAVDEALAGEGPLAETIAAGLTVRLAPIPFDRAEARAEVEAILAGAASSHPAPARAWARALTRDQTETLDRHALGAAERCLDEIRALKGGPRPEDPHWRKAVLAALHERDDLEGVRLLLAEAGPDRGLRLAAALDALDDYGETFALVIPDVAAHEDERLRRARTVSPEGWWTLPRRWPEDHFSDD